MRLIKCDDFDTMIRVCEELAKDGFTFTAEYQGECKGWHVLLDGGY